jgi:hypothetical protein
MKQSGAIMGQRAVTKVDLRKRLRSYYQPSTYEVSIVDVPAMPFLMIDGAGDPNTAEEYREAIEALYGVAYPIKFLLKEEQRLDYTVMPLEGLWWAPDTSAFSLEDKDHWLWTMIIAQPPEITAALVERAREQAQRKKPSPALGRLRLEELHEGLAAQIMHLWPYATEGPTITRLQAFIREQGYVFDGRQQKHHEIYLSDPGRTAPAKLRTVIRQPMTRLVDHEKEPI